MDLTLINRTPHPAAALRLSAPGVNDVSVIARATFSITIAGTGGGSASLTPSPVEAPLVLTDVPSGENPLAPPRYESDFIPFKPKADCLCVGTAHPPGGAASPGCVVSFGVGRHFDKSIVVVGDRQWEPRMGGLRLGMADPLPFRSMPVTYEHAYGGKDPASPDGFDFFDHNPVGKGYSRAGAVLRGLPLPNLEHPARLIKSWRDRVEPRGFGPVGRTWQPRLARAGTYDPRWIAERAPRLPLDFNEAYYNGAPEDQQVAGFLRGDEEIRVSNMHPKHSTLNCRLPAVRVRCLVDRPAGGWSRLEDLPMNLDTLWVDADALLLVLVWRGRFTLDRLAAGTRLLLVDEPLSTSPPSPETYRPKLPAASSATEEDEEIDAAQEAPPAQEELVEQGPDED